MILAFFHLAMFALQQKAEFNGQDIEWNFVISLMKLPSVIILRFVDLDVEVQWD